MCTDNGFDMEDFSVEILDWLCFDKIMGYIEEDVMYYLPGGYLSVIRPVSWWEELGFYN